MNDELAIAQIEKITADEYKKAFIAIREQMAESDLLMLKSHYEATNHDVTSSQLTSMVGFSGNIGAANLRYGILASKLLEFFQIQLKNQVKLNILVTFDDSTGEWHWTLRPQVVQALSELKSSGWFG